MFRFNFTVDGNDRPVCSVFIKFDCFNYVTCVRQCGAGWGFG